MFAFFGRRVLKRLRNRSVWVSRAVILVGVVKWVANRPRRTVSVEVPRGATLVVGMEQGERE